MTIQKQGATVSSPTLEMVDLHVAFDTRRGRIQAVNGVSFSLRAGERLGIVGESGSGKSVTAQATVQLIPSPGRITRGDVRLKGRSIPGLGRRELQGLRGSEVAMIFQDPMTSLNPVYTVGHQLTEAIRLHQQIDKAAARRYAAELLASVHIPQPESRLSSYPHQFSGGMRQRVMIAMALANNPAVLIADEPTTALDVTTQKQILKLLDELCRAHGTAVVFITHDLGVVAEFCDRVVVMYGGQVMETAPTARLFRSPQHPYTLGLLESLPHAHGEELTPIPGELPDPRRLPQGCIFHPRCRYSEARCQQERPALRSLRPGQEVACHRAEEVAGFQRQGTEPSTSASDREGSKTPVLEVRELVKHYPLGRTGAFVSAVEGVSFTLYRGETLALVGESGSGKTTTAMTTLRLTDPTSGEVAFEGNDIFALRGRALRTFRHGAQVVFQDPYSSLDPRMNVRDLISEPMVIQGEGTRQERTARAEELLELVGLQVADGARFPHQFSGGQRQRIAIARALALHPTLLVCDEPVSALDVSVQAQILNLLKKLQRELELSYLFIAHDLSVVRYIADRVAVMYLGKIVELGSKTEIFENPQHPYTQALLSASPVPNPETKNTPITLSGEIPSPVDPPAGCRFHTRCPLAEEVCRKQEPPLRQLSGGQLVACHLAEE